MRITKKVFIGVASLLVAAGAFVALLSATGVTTNAFTATERRDCGYTDTIVDCGTVSISELLDVYNKNNDRRGNRDIQTIFNHYGVQSSDITGSTSTVKKGLLKTDGTIVVDNKVVAYNAQSLYRAHPGKQVSPITIGGKSYYTGPVAGNYVWNADLFVFFNKDGTFRVAIQASCGNPIAATNKVTPPKPPTPPKAIYACESLKATKLSRTEFRFDATASAQNATIRSYTFTFGDGSTETVTTSAKTASVTHKYADVAKTYPAQVTVTMSDGSKATSQNCKTSVTVVEKPVEAKPSIDIVKTVNGKEHAKVAVGTDFTYEITVRNTGNVVLKNAVVTDKAPKEVTLLSVAVGTISGNEWKYTIPELKVGESKRYTIKAEYAKYASGTHKNTVCVDTPTVPGGPDDCDDATTETSELIEVCDLTDNTVKTIDRSEFDEKTMTTDLSKCGEIKVCIIEDKVVKVIAKKDYDETTMTTDMSKCEEVPVIPKELPKTGLEAFIGGSLGVGSISAASYYWAASRRTLLNALLKK